MRQIPRSAFVLLSLLLLLPGACSAPYQAPVDDAGGAPRFLTTGRTHRVNGGETLYAVAWMYDLDFAALARANNLREPYTITPGQELTVDLRSMPPAPQQVAVAPSQAITSPVVVGSGIQRSALPSTPLQRQSLPPAGDPAPQATTPPPAELPPTNPAVATEPSPATRIPPAPTPVTPAVPPVPTGNTGVTLPAPPASTTVPPAVAVTPPQTVTPPAPGETPSLPAPAETSTNAGTISWDWPASGNIVGRFTDSGMDNKGLDLAGNRGDPVLAAAAGEVVYAGSGLLRYGDLVILKHSERYLSAYAHNSAILVKEGERVTRGQKIAELGSSGIDRNMLHFEIRLDGKPVDPLSYLPSR